MFGLQVDERLGHLTVLQQELQEECLNVFRAMGELWMRLLVPKDGSTPKLIADPRFRDMKPQAVNEERDVPLAVVQQLIRAGLIGALTEHRNQGKIGWREAGLPGETNEVYCLVQ